jgi:hypothetical protein
MPVGPGGHAMDASRHPAARAALARSLALVAVLALGACAGSEREGLIAKGATPAYADGYVDGCSSGKAAGGSTFDQAQKDASRFGSDAEYTKGWNDAFGSCKAAMAQMVAEARRRNPSRDK